MQDIHRLVCKCGEVIPQARVGLGYMVCMDCGEVAARQRRYTSAPINKSNYILITKPEQLRQLNPKRLGDAG